MTKPRDLYAILGVHRLASKAAIQRAYRKRALETHPDRQGDPEEFKAVQLAFEVLFDDERRQHYDATGQFDEAKADPAVAAATAILSTCLAAIVQGLILLGRGVSQHNVVELMRLKIKDGIGELEKQQKELANAVAVLKETAARASAAEGENVVAEIANTHVAGIEQQIKRVEEPLAHNRLALEMLKHSSFRCDGFGGTAMGRSFRITFGGFASSG